MSSIYTHLGIKTISDKEEECIRESIDKFYKLSSSLSFYNPNYHLLTQYVNPRTVFNNEFRLIKLIKKKRRINTLGHIYRAKFITKKHSFYHADTFIKELPLLPLEQSYLYYKQYTQFPTALTHMLYDYIYNTNSQNNIEVFSLYATSKLVELDINPHFCKFYGCWSTVMKKFTFDITHEKNIKGQFLADILTDNEGHSSLIQNKKGLFIEFENYPCYLVASEKADLDIDFLYDNNLIDYNFVRSIVFQIFSAIVTMNSLLGMKHNDLHLGNIMLSIANESHIYYSFENVYYKVPTYGYVIKIIDWGRATYNFNGHKGYNNIFQSECFGQYVFPYIHNKGLSPLLPEKNRWTDITMISHNLLNLLKDYRDSEIGKLLYSNITAKDGTVLNVESFKWGLYTDISQKKFDICPKRLFRDNVFKSYKIKKSKIPMNAQIYEII
jgi:hypothetical protein